MSYYNKNILGQKIVGIIPTFDVGSSATSKPINGRLCTINVLEGAVWVNPNTNATQSNGVQVTGALDVVVPENLSLISDTTGAKVQIILWG